MGPALNQPRTPAPKLDRSGAFVLLGLVAVWGGTAWGTHWLFDVGWGWSVLLGPVLLVMGYIYLLGTTSGSVAGGKKLASIFERRGPPPKV
jgi:hypothetical protein